MLKAGVPVGFRNSTFFEFASKMSVPLTPASAFFCPAGVARKYSAQANFSAANASVANALSNAIEATAFLHFM
jgi:hypothetical protein